MLHYPFLFGYLPWAMLFHCKSTRMFTKNLHVIMSNINIVGSLRFFYN
jgi:hypothetical protein